MNEFLMGRQTFDQLTPEQQKNALETLRRINIIRAAYGKAMKVNDGVRRMQDQPKNAATKSNHLIGAAIDIDDDDAGTLWFWLMKPEQMQMLKDVGLWLEHGCYTHNKQNGTWVHFQIVAPGSGKRIYVPSSQPNPNPTFWNGKYDPMFN
jgi:hypothetical protein